MVSMELAAAAARVAANDNSHAGLRGLRVELVAGMGSVLAGVVERVERNRWGVSALVALENGGEEWVRVESIRPRGSRGIGCNLL